MTDAMKQAFLKKAETDYIFSQVDRWYKLTPWESEIKSIQIPYL